MQGNLANSVAPEGMSSETYTHLSQLADRLREIAAQNRSMYVTLANHFI